MKYFYLFLLSLLFIITSCRKDENHPVNFYYWKSNISLGDTEKDYFKKLESKKLYIRFFDVDIEDAQILPKAKIQPFNAQELAAEYIPVVFITNRTFENQSQEELKRLTEKFLQLITEIKEKNQIPESNEIQLDCDWTEKTRANYFFFISELKKITKKDISCTVRLHQIKYKSKTGIPPVFKAYLMCYATSNPTESTVSNSILDIPLLKDYTQNINDYPLQFDIALPLYSWAVVTNHLGRIKLINGVTEKDLSASYFKKIGENIYEVEEDCFLQGMYINKGFTLRIEQIMPGLLKEARNYLNEKIQRPYNIVYYHLDKPFLERFTIEELR